MDGFTRFTRWAMLLGILLVAGAASLLMRTDWAPRIRILEPQRPPRQPDAAPAATVARASVWSAPPPPSPPSPGGGGAPDVSLDLAALDALAARARAGLEARMSEFGVSAARLAQGMMLIGALAPYHRLAVKAVRLRKAPMAAAGGVAAVDGGDAEEISLLLFGGSTAAGAELGEASQIFAAIFAKWLSDIVELPIGMLNMAIGATASEYYSLCGGAHMKAGVDILIGEHALNDMYYGYGNRSDPGAAHIGSILEQVIVQGWRRAPDAAFMYAGVYPRAGSCGSGEDLPGNVAVLRNGDVAYLSTRNLVVGRPPAEATAPTASIWAAWDWGHSDACNPNAVPPPFAWANMFTGGGHPGGMASYGLCLMMLATVVEAWEALARQRWVAPAPTPLPVPLHDGRHGPPCRGGLAFECRTMLSPSFGLHLRPLPTACVVTWREPRAPMFDAATCGADVWGGGLDAESVPAGWAVTEMGDFRHEVRGTISVRKDSKSFLVANEIGARARFPVRVGARGEVGVAYFTGGVFGRSTFTLLCGDTAVPCGEGAPKPTVVDANAEQYVTRTVIIASGVAHGEYVLEVNPEPGRTNIVAVASA